MDYYIIKFLDKDEFNKAIDSFNVGQLIRMDIEYSNMVFKFEDRKLRNKIANKFIKLQLKKFDIFTNKKFSYTW